MTNQHGGKRPGAGRPATPTGRSISKTLRVSRAVADYLSARGTGIVEDMIRRSRDFKAWLKK